MYSPLLAVILLVSCGRILVLHSQPFFLWTVRSACRKKRLLMRDQPVLSSTRDVIAFSSYKLKVIMPCATEEWSGRAICRLQPVLYGFLLFWDYTLVISPLAQCNNYNGKMMTMIKTAVQLQFGGKPCILLQSTCTTTYQVTTRVKQSIWSHKQAVAMFQQKIRGNNFRGWGKIHKNSEIYCPQKLPTIRFVICIYHIT